MVSLALPKMDDDLTINAGILVDDSQLEQYAGNQQWDLLSKSLEIYFLWLLSMMIIYALIFAMLMYVRNSKENQETNDRKSGKNEQNSDNTAISINDRDLYPILNLAGDQSNFYLKYLDVGRIPKTNKLKLQDIDKQKQWTGSDERRNIGS